MSLIIKYSLKTEQQRLENTINKLPWYDKFGYAPRFPQGINPRVDNLKKVFSVLGKEYDEAEYEKSALKIKKEFSKIEDDFFRKMEQACGKRIKRNYKLILTKYGVGGSYSLPDKIIYNFGMKSSSLHTVLHEIVHLAIEPYIKKYQIQQFAKERIVDLICLKVAGLKNYKMNKKADVFKKSIDPLFKKHFKPLIDNFFKQFSDCNRQN